MRNALRYEITRVTSLRSTWALIAAALLLQFVVATAYANTSGMTPREQFVASFSGISLLLVTLMPTAIAVASFGHEYRYRTIATTMLTLRRPVRILAAKAIVAAVIGAVTATAMIAVTLLAEGTNNAVPTELWRVGEVWTAVVLYAVLSTLSALGVAAVTRNATFALVAVIAVPAVIEMGVMLAGASIYLTPFRATAQLVARHSGQYNTAMLPLPLVALTVVLLGAGTWVLKYRGCLTNLRLGW